MFPRYPAASIAIEWAVDESFVLQYYSSRLSLLQPSRCIVTIDSHDPNGGRCNGQSPFRASHAHGVRHGGEANVDQKLVTFSSLSNQTLGV